VVRTDPKSGLKSVAYDHLVGPIIEAIKTLTSRLTQVEANVAQLLKFQIKSHLNSQGNQIEELKARIQILEKQNAATKAYLCKKEPMAEVCH
jgi:TolA-binding protein